MINYYTLSSYKKDKKPLYVVHISHIMLSGTYFFLSMQAAKEFLQAEISNLAKYAPLVYNPDAQESQAHYAMIEEVCKNPDLCIGTNGRTYSKKLFPAGL